MYYKLFKKYYELLKKCFILDEQKTMFLWCVQCNCRTITVADLLSPPSYFG